MAKNYTFCKVQATSAEFKAPEGEKKASVVVELKVIECDDPSQVGRNFTEFMSLSGGATEYTVKNLRALGWSCNDITELAGVGSMQTKGGIYEDTYNGVTREKVNVFAPKPALKGDVKKKFAAQFKAAAAKEKPFEVTEENAALAREALPIQDTSPAETDLDDIF